MYDPKDVLTEEGYQRYLAHIVNISDGLFYIQNHSDDLHIGAIDQELEDSFGTILEQWGKIRDKLITGDGEKQE